MRDRLITVFGGSGFIGRYVVQELARTGARIRVAEREPRHAWFLKPLAAVGQIQFVAADVTRPDTVARAVQGSDTVINLVGSFEHPEAINGRGAGNVAQAAAAAGAAMVHMSALGADRDASSEYGRSKGAGEAAVRAAAPDAVILRPSVVFGREDAFVNRFARLIAALPIVPVLRPAAKFQPVYVGDVALALATVVRSPVEHAGRTYSLGGPDTLTMMALFRWIAKTIGHSPVFVPLPDPAGLAIALAPGTGLSRDQWRMLETDNVVPADAPGLRALGITATPLGAVAPGWLVQYRRHGRFGTKTA